jgi:hypothetical protein
MICAWIGATVKWNVYHPPPVVSGRSIGHHHQTILARNNALVNIVWVIHQHAAIIPEIFAGFFLQFFFAIVIGVGLPI